MFTGIIEAMGMVEEIIITGENRSFWMSSPISDDLKEDQSVAHNGVCLTVDERRPGMHRVTAIAETLRKTNLGEWQNGGKINLERCLPMNGRLDGHLVQGHVDTTAVCTQIKDENGSWLISFSFPAEHAVLIIEKGSVCINGTSLTAFNVGPDSFSVAIIPYTWMHTNMHMLAIGNKVNIEFDMVGKYILRHTQLKPLQ